MKTITFYSYKGGVGRTLALSNIALRLSELDKKVCLLDFDLEAPGLRFKFKNNKKEIKTGIVDYIYEYSQNGTIPDQIKKYSITLDPINSNFLPINFIPAGNIEDREYWKKLSQINWSEMFYSEKGKGVRFILDLKAKIEKEFAPDVLLIDSRTGITDISGITLKLLADDVVILSSYNDEGLFGSKKIIMSLRDDSTIFFEKIPKIHFVLTRLPFGDELLDKVKEDNLLLRVKRELVSSSGISDLEISTIHSDRRLEENERQLIGYEYERKSVSISNDYLKLFDALTSDILSYDEVKLFKNKKMAEKEFNKSRGEKELSVKMQLLNRAIELDNTKGDYFFERGNLFTDMNEYKKAISDYNKSLELNPNNYNTYNNLIFCYRRIDNLDKAIDYSHKLIELDPQNLTGYYNLSVLLTKRNQLSESLSFINKALEIENMNSQILNNRADLYRNLGELEKAFSDIYKAIEINSTEPINFGTLAEIFASAGKMEEFYFNLNIALGMGLTAKNMSTARDVYEKVRREDRFINLLKKFDIDIDDIFGTSGQ